jgi:hypothetical protein
VHSPFRHEGFPRTGGRRDDDALTASNRFDRLPLKIVGLEGEACKELVEPLLLDLGPLGRR